MGQAHKSRIYIYVCMRNLCYWLPITIIKIMIKKYYLQNAVQEFILSKWKMPMSVVIAIPTVYMELGQKCKLRVVKVS
jgi:hypothetical protein